MVTAGTKFEVLKFGGNLEEKGCALLGCKGFFWLLTHEQTIRHRILQHTDAEFKGVHTEYTYVWMCIWKFLYTLDTNVFPYST